MTKTTSTMLPLGTEAPLFSLPDVVTHQHYHLKPEPQTLATVILFICNHCPYVKHIIPELIRLPKDYAHQPVRWIAISANDASNYPDDAPDKMQQAALTLQYPFPYLYDETQEVARAYQAACTPDIFVFDHALKLAYRGQLDDSRPGNAIPLTGFSLRTALDALLTHQPIPEPQKPSIGCNIKWKVA